MAGPLAGPAGPATYTALKSRIATGASGRCVSVDI